jgi:NAD(P)H-dependent FMN reductase
MPDDVSLLAVSGSTRAASYNRLLVEVAARGAEAAGARVTRVDLREFALPLYDADAEAAGGLPERAAALKALFVASDGYLIAAPEYNGSLPAVLKNAIDWVSRPTPGSGETPFTLAGFRGKVAGLMSASPGAWGGMRGLTHLRQILGGMEVLLVPEQLAVPTAHQAFDDQGRLINPAHHGLAETIGRRAARLARALTLP